MKKTLVRVLAPMLMGLGIVVVGASTASAHTPNINATCNGVVVNGTSYGNDGFDWSITVDGSTTTGHFGDSGTQTVPVPQGGATTSWSASIDAPGTQYDDAKSGSVGPCGQPPVPPKPADDKESRTIVDDPDCENFTVTTLVQERSRTYTLVNNQWVAGPWTDWATTDTDTRVASMNECPPGPKPEPIEEITKKGSPKCGESSFTQTITSTFRDSVLNEDREWVAAPPVVTVTEKKVDVKVTPCPKPPVEEPPVLPDTGAQDNLMGLGVLALALMAAGGGALVTTRKK